MPTQSSLNLHAGENPGAVPVATGYDVGTREGRKVRGATRVMLWHWHALAPALQTCVDAPLAPPPTPH
jgi:hypothetical protein